MFPVWFQYDQIIRVTNLKSYINIKRSFNSLDNCGLAYLNMFVKRKRYLCFDSKHYKCYLSSITELSVAPMETTTTWTSIWSLLNSRCPKRCTRSKWRQSGIEISTKLLCWRALVHNSQLRSIFKKGQSSFSAIDSILIYS